ncbi:MAG: catalase [Oscillatoria sp. SIO1A7]|nr:catalase [Oscillatoria sp. SIO1A7]
MKKILDKIVLFFFTIAVGLLFALGAANNKARTTHKYGVGGAGQLRIVDDPAFPEHEFFQAGRTFPVLLRHGTVTFEDDAAMDIRSASIKFLDKQSETALDLIMNTGPRTFLNAINFWQFTMASISGREEGEPVSSKGLEAFLKENPVFEKIFATSLRRSPDSFAQLYYYSKLVNYFKAKDGKIRYVKYRLIPESGLESGIPSAKDMETPWLQKRLDSENRPIDYLRAEYVERASQQEIIYKLQLRLQENVEDNKERIFSQEEDWDESTSPWLDLATVAIDRALSSDETEKLHFNIGNQPDSLGIVEGESISDPNSINSIRTRVYKWASSVRFFIYWLTEKFDKSKPAFSYYGEAGRDLPRFDFTRPLPSSVQPTGKYFAQLGLRVLPFANVIPPIISERIGFSAMPGKHAAEWMPANLTRCHPDKFSDAFFVERRLNGFNPGKLNRVAGQDWQYAISYNTGRYKLEPGGLLPKFIEARFVLDGENLQVHSIKFELGEEIATHFPGDLNWEWSKRLFRSAEFVYQEIQTHLGRTHMNMDQYAMAFYRNVKNNPIRQLLEPHLEGLLNINKRGAALIIGNTGFLPEASALTPESVFEVLKDEVKELSYKWSPVVQALPDRIVNNYFDRAALCTWSLLEEYVGQFFEENRQGIREHWQEIEDMSRDLIVHSILPPEKGSLAIAGIEDLRQLCIYVIYHSTFFHSWVNGKQYEDGGDVDYAAIGLWDKGDRSYNQNTVDEKQEAQVKLMWQLANVHYNPIMEVGPVALKNLFWKYRDRIEPGIPLEWIMTSINI